MALFSKILTAARCFCFLKCKRADSWVGNQDRVLQVLKIACELEGGTKGTREKVSLLHVEFWAPVACQAPLSMGFSRKEYWSELPFPVPGDFPNPRIEPASLVSPALAGRFVTTLPPGKSPALDAF